MKVFKDVTFQKYSSYIYKKFGIQINMEKKDMLHTKLLKLMLQNNIDSFEEYFDILSSESDIKIMNEFLDEITIHKTDFFRENNHFNFIRNNLNFILEKNKGIARNNEIRVWSAGCSTGEEPYTLSMVLSETFPEYINQRVLGTDISSKVLIKAQAGIYPSTISHDVDKYYLSKYFDKVGNEYKVKSFIKNKITFRQFNLSDEFPFKKSFDMIFCRNVMIYFDASSQQELLDKFYNTLSPGGILFIGHSESINYKKHCYQYLEPTVYLK